MSLVLNLGGSPESGGNSRRIEVADRLTIGRGADNDLVLADPDRTLSKNHCTILFDGRGYAVTDNSTNGVFLDNAPERLPRGVPMPLREGSVLRLGNYQLTVTAIAPPGVAATARPPAPANPDDGLFGDPLSGAPDPFADPFAAPDPFASPGSHRAAPSHAPPPRSAPLHSAPLHPVTPASGDDDIFGGPPQGGGGTGGPLIPDDVDLFGDKKPDPWQGPSVADHAPSDQAFFSPPKVQVEAIPDDWDLSDLGVSLGHKAPTPQSPFAEPGLAVPPAGAPPRPAAPASAGDDAAIAGFLAAAGLAGTTLTPAEKERVLREAGTALAETVKGLTEILAARANTKQEFRIERTTIGAMGNNPLKFSASLDEAMRAMLLGRVPGFLTATQAIEEALADVKSHQLAVLAGMQVALSTVIARFDPAKLEQRLEQSSLIAGILPGARKAKYWELFKTLYKEIAGELQDDFQKLFGAEFARAYKDQIDKL